MDPDGGRQAGAPGRPLRVLAVAPGVVATPMQAEIRRSSARDFPEVARFVELDKVGALREPDQAAREIWSLLSRDFQNGAVLDLRSPDGTSATP